MSLTKKIGILLMAGATLLYSDLRREEDLLMGSYLATQQTIDSGMVNEAREFARDNINKRYPIGTGYYAQELIGLAAAVAGTLLFLERDKKHSQAVQ